MRHSNRCEKRGLGSEGNMTDLQSIIKKIDELAPLPLVAKTVLAVIEDPESSTDDLAEVIITDRDITAHLMRICNSAYLALSDTIESVHQTIIYLGMDQVVDLVLMTGGAENLKGEHRGYNLKEGELWRFSVSSALIARDLAQKRGSKRNHDIFTSALLKDIGKVILDPYVQNLSQKIRSRVQNLGLSPTEAEKKAIGIDHAELSAMVAEKWGLSPKTVHIIRNHHLPAGIEANDFESCLVYLADTLCLMMGMGEGTDGLTRRRHQEIIDRADFSQEDLEEIMDAYGVKFRKVEELLDLS
jgi:HD-like signal output (HDOD) protein